MKGNYAVLIDIEKSLTITGNSTAEVTLVGTDDYVIDVDADSVTLRNLTLLNGSGLFLDKLSSDIILERLLVSGSDSHGLYVFQNSNLVVTDSTFTDNDHNGVLVSSADGVEFTRITMTGNGESGLNLVTSDSVSVRDSQIHDNGAGNWEVQSSSSDGLVMDNVSLSGKNLIWLEDNEQAQL